MNEMWVPVVGIVFGIPAIGFAARMIIRALADGIARVKAASHPSVVAPDPTQGQRIAQLEAEVSSLRDEVGRLSAVESFYAQLQGPRAPGERVAPGGLPGPGR